MCFDSWSSCFLLSISFPSLFEWVEEGGTSINKRSSSYSSHSLSYQFLTSLLFQWYNSNNWTFCGTVIFLALGLALSRSYWTCFFKFIFLSFGEVCGKLRIVCKLSFMNRIFSFSPLSEFLFHFSHFRNLEFFNIISVKEYSGRCSYILGMFL